jgi:HlyD family secretion protein
MPPKTKRRLVYGAIGAVVLLLIVLALIPDPVEVDVVPVERGPMVVTVDQKGETRVRERFVVTAPIASRVRRIAFREGDRVEEGAVIALLESVPLDPRERQTAEARVQSALESLRQAEAGARRAVTEADLASRERSRIEKLAAEGVISDEVRDQAVARATGAQRELEGARHRARSAAADLDATRAALIGEGGAARSIELRSPASGRILSIAERSERIVAPGEPVATIGDATELELVIDVLSRDAVRISPGNRVIVDDWGGDRPLEGRVRVVGPGGYTKVSALGVEEQRVDVVADVSNPPPNLGDAYRFEARIVVWEGSDVVKVPVSALWRAGEEWSVYVIDGGRARATRVDIGRRNQTEAEVRSGVREGVRVIVHPPNEVDDGARVRARE